MKLGVLVILLPHLFALLPYGFWMQLFGAMRYLFLVPWNIIAQRKLPWSEPAVTGTYGPRVRCLSMKKARWSRLLRQASAPLAGSWCSFSFPASLPPTLLTLKRVRRHWRIQNWCLTLARFNPWNQVEGGIARTWLRLRQGSHHSALFSRLYLQPYLGC